jgi:hypothetical protein
MDRGQQQPSFVSMFVIVQELDLSCFFEVINSRCQVLLLRLYFYKTSKEQLKANSQTGAERSGTARDQVLQSLCFRGKFRKKGLGKIDAPDLEKLA